MENQVSVIEDKPVRNKGLYYASLIVFILMVIASIAAILGMALPFVYAIGFCLYFLIVVFLTIFSLGVIWASGDVRTVAGQVWNWLVGLNDYFIYIYATIPYTVPTAFTFLVASFVLNLIGLKKKQKGCKARFITSIVLLSVVAIIGIATLIAYLNGENK